MHQGIGTGTKRDGPKPTLRGLFPIRANVGRALPAGFSQRAVVADNARPAGPDEWRCLLSDLFFANPVFAESVCRLYSYSTV